MASNKVQALILATFSSSALTSSFQAINPNGFSNPIFFLRIVNGSSNAITISFDGTNANETVLGTSAFDLPLQTNAQPPNWVAKLAAGTVVYVKGTAGTGTNDITVSGYYQTISV